MKIYIVNWENNEVEFRINDMMLDDRIVWTSLVSDTSQDFTIRHIIACFSQPDEGDSGPVKVYYMCNEDSFLDFIDAVKHYPTIKGYRLK